MIIGALQIHRYRVRIAYGIYGTVKKVPVPILKVH